MEPREIEDLRKKLEFQCQESRQFLRRVDQEAQSLDSDSVQDSADRSVISLSRESLFERSSQRRTVLRLIEAALERIGNGSFGTCIGCGNDIQSRRLEAVPWTPFCLRCQGKRELELGSRGIDAESSIGRTLEMRWVGGFVRVRGVESELDGRDRNQARRNRRCWHENERSSCFGGRIVFLEVDSQRDDPAATSHKRAQKRDMPDNVTHEMFSTKWFLLVLLIAFSMQLLAQDKIPAGTILPVQLDHSLHSNKARPGDQVSARVMQDVPLPGRHKIKAGARVVGHIVSARPAVDGMMAEISFRFDTLAMGKRRVPILTDLRALATMMDVSDAQIPKSGPDRGTPENWWTTDQIGGEVVYGGAGVAHGPDIVGNSVLGGGVLVPVRPRSGMKCRGEIAGNDQPQALWVFSSDACGLYDLPSLTLKHAGRTGPVGLIKLLSNKRNVKVQAGSGLLLRVIGPAR